jgi:hypothetical protein
MMVSDYLIYASRQTLLNKDSMRRVLKLLYKKDIALTRAQSGFQKIIALTRAREEGADIHAWDGATGFRSTPMIRRAARAGKHLLVHSIDPGHAPGPAACLCCAMLILLRDCTLTCPFPSQHQPPAALPCWCLPTLFLSRVCKLQTWR